MIIDYILLSGLRVQIITRKIKICFYKIGIKYMRHRNEILRRKALKRLKPTEKQMILDLTSNEIQVLRELLARWLNTCESFGDAMEFRNAGVETTTYYAKDLLKKLEDARDNRLHL